jgi:N6-L-threonylcarbamoyladenine synthase
MIDADNLDFSFSGLKTASLRLIEQHEPLDEKTRAQIAHELETAIVDVLTTKTIRAGKQTDAESVLAGGGVTANTYLRKKLKRECKQVGADFMVSPKRLATDNAVIIALAARQLLRGSEPSTYTGDDLDDLTADSRLSL